MTTPTDNFRPPWAIIMWADDTHIYSEIPCVSGPPLIQRYSQSEAGLTKALSFLRGRKAAQGKGKVHPPPPPPGTLAVARPTSKRKLLPGLTDEDRLRAQAILKKKGLL